MSEKYLVQKKGDISIRSRTKINAPDCAGFWFTCKAHLPVHISGYVLVDATQQTDQRTSQMVYLLELGKPRPMGGGNNSFA